MLWQLSTVFMNEDIIQVYGFTLDPNTFDYIIVMYHAENGSLKKISKYS